MAADGPVDGAVLAVPVVGATVAVPPLQAAMTIAADANKAASRGDHMRDRDMR